MAVIKLRAGKTTTKEEMIAHCKANLSSFKIPKQIIFVDELLKTPTGKILKRDMREAYKEIFKSVDEHVLGTRDLIIIPISAFIHGSTMT